MDYSESVKLEIDTIKSVFPKTHNRFQTISTAKDEIIFNFFDQNGQGNLIHCEIPELYPTVGPVWHASGASKVVSEVVESFERRSDCKNCLIIEVIKLIRGLCHRHSLSVPPEIDQLESPIPSKLNANVDEAEPSTSVQADVEPMGPMEEDDNVM